MSRLEEIKRAYNYPYNNEVGYPYWLISRVDELEQKIELERNMNKNLADLNYFLQKNPELSKHRYGESVSLIAMDALKTLKEENECYKQALEFYADKKTYNLGVKFSMGTAHPRHEPIKFDQGEKARKALEEIE